MGEWMEVGHVEETEFSRTPRAVAGGPAMVAAAEPLGERLITREVARFDM